MENESKTQDKKAEFVTLHVPFPSSFVYSSATAFSLSMMDLKISFAEAMPNRTVEARVGVTLPIEHAAHLAMALVAQMGAYENNFGLIRHQGWQNFKAMLNGFDASKMVESSPESPSVDDPPQPAS